MGAITSHDVSFWGFAEADPTLVGLVAVAVTILAVLYVVMRLAAPARLDRARERAASSLKLHRRDRGA